MRRLLALLLLVAAPSVAHADWIVAPFVGTTFGASTNILLITQAGNKKFNFGASFGVLSDGVFGLEASASHVPRFFETNSGTNLVLNSGITTLEGSVIVAVPQAITGYSLRPYLVSGVGLMHASSRDISLFNSFDSNLLALNVGGGAIGMLSDRSGVRFEVRNFRNLKPDSSTTTLSGNSVRISFWRATVGVLFRF
jgi:hypothetical protein